MDNKDVFLGNLITYFHKLNWTRKDDVLQSEFECGKHYIVKLWGGRDGKCLQVAPTGSYAGYTILGEDYQLVNDLYAKVWDHINNLESESFWGKVNTAFVASMKS